MYEKILNMAFNSVFEKSSVLIRALAIYLLVMIFIDYMNMDNIVYIEGKAEIKSGFVLFITIILSYIVFIMTAVTTHRILIIGEDSIPHFGLYKFSKREWNFFKNALFMGIIVSAILIPAFIIGLPFGSTGVIMGVSIFLIAGAIIVSRLSLIFPAISVDKDITLTDAWNCTKNYKLLVFITVILFPVLFSLIFGFVYGIAIDFLSKLLGNNLLFLNSILSIFITVFTISALSATYKLINEEHPEFFDSNKVIGNEEIRETKVESIDNSHKITIHDKSGIIFEELIDKLKDQYFKLGFTDIVIDKEDFWMIKNPEIEESYVLLSYVDDEFVIEVYQGDMVEFLDELKVEK